MQQLAEEHVTEGKLEDLGVDPSMRKGSASFAVSNWFNSAAVIRGLLIDARKSLEKEGRSRAKEELCGFTLPLLYERYSGERFTIPRARDVGKVPSVAFVKAAHKAIGLGEIGAETIRSHWQKARRRNAK
jgi:hypothetical protein